VKSTSEERMSKTLTLGQISAFQILHLVNTEHSEQCHEQSHKG